MKRRDFILGTAGAIGVVVPGLSRGEAKPCPPPTVQVSGGTAASSTCDQAVAPGAPSWLQNKAVNQWFEIPNTSLRALDQSLGAVRPTPPGSPGAKINAWCGATIRRTGSVYLIAASGGHGDYAGNEVNALALNTDTPAWVELVRPSTTADLINDLAVYADLRCASTHTYNTTQFINQDDRLVRIPYAGLNMSSVRSPTAQEQSLYPQSRMMCSFSAVNWTAYNTGNVWDVAQIQASGTTPRNGYYATAPSGFNGNIWGMGRCSDPLTGDIYTGSNPSGLWKWTRATNSWAQITSGMSLGYGTALAMDRVVRNGEPYRRLLFTSETGHPADAGMYRADTGAKLALTLQSGSLNWSVLGAGQYTGVVFDEYNDRFIVFVVGGGNFVMYSVTHINPTTYDIRSIPLVAASGSTVPNVTARNGIHNAVQYVPELKGVVIADTYDGNVHFMRTA